MRIDNEDAVTLLTRKLTKEGRTLTEAETLAWQDQLTKLMDMEGGYAVIQPIGLEGFLSKLRR